MEHFELLHSSLICDKIPVSEYISRKSGLTVAIAETDGPIVKGFFSVVTETFDDDGIPHILEHVLLAGSKQYPYKRALDLITKRCLGSECYATSDVDNICYIMQTAGSEGFLTLMPVFLDYIFHPVLSEESFLTEVHHITGEGKDGGLVYSEMQDSGVDYPRVDLIIARNIYPGKCGYSSETSGIPKNLRESVNMTKVRHFHKEFHRLENLKIIITGQIQPSDVFKTLEKLEEKIINEEDRKPFQRPWQNPPLPLTDSKDVIVEYAADEETNGVFSMAWRIGSCITNSYIVQAIDILLHYLTLESSSPLRKEIVNTEAYEPAGVSYYLNENSDTCASITFHDVPVSKLQDVKTQLQTIFKRILEHGDVDIQCIEDVIKFKLADSISQIDNMSHVTISCMITPYMIYGNTNEEFQDRMNPQNNLKKLLKEPKSFWLKLLKKYFIENKYVAIQCLPSILAKEKMIKEEEERIQAHIQRLTESGLKEKSDILENAIKFKERDPPLEMITSIPTPSFHTLKFHNIVRYTTDSDEKQPIDLSKAPIFTCFDNINTGFVHICTLLDTSNVPSDLRNYLPLLLKSLQLLPVERGGNIIPYKEIIKELKDNTGSVTTSLGYNGEVNYFKCGNYSQTCIVTLKVEPAKYEIGFTLLKELLYKTIFTVERLKTIALKMKNRLEVLKMNGSIMALYALDGICFSKDSNIIKSGIVCQSKFLTDLVKKLNSKAGNEVLENMEKLRKIITKPSNTNLYIAGNLDCLKNPVEPISEFLLSELGFTKCQQKLNLKPDYNFLKFSDSLNGCIIPINQLESPSFCQATRSITSYTDPDLPALMVYLKYLTENPKWKQMRENEYFNNGEIKADVNKGLLYLIYDNANNIIEAYNDTKEIVYNQLVTKEWNGLLLEIVKNSLIVDLIEEQYTISFAVHTSIKLYFHNVDYNYYNRILLDLIQKVTIEDLNRIGEKYIAGLFNSCKTAVVVNPSKLTEITDGFKKLGLNLTEYSSLEESFLNAL